jgi:hypothetical protein
MLFNAHKKTIDSLQHTLAQHASLLDAIERSMAVTSEANFTTLHRRPPASYTGL